MALLPTDPNDRRALLLGLQIAGTFGYLIAVPLILFVLIGTKIDSWQGTGYRYTIIAFVLAALVSGRLVYRRAKEYGKEYDEITKKKNP